MANTNNNATAPLLQRVFLFLEDGDWSSADEYCEKVLDMEPQNAMAYVAKLMTKLRVKTQEKLSDCEKPFDDENYYQKAIRFADNKLKAFLTESVNTIKNRILEKDYQAVMRKKEKAITGSDYINVADAFKRLGEYKDSAVLAKEMFLEGKYKNALSMKKGAKTYSDYNEAADAFKELGEYKDSSKVSSECYDKANELYTEE